MIKKITSTLISSITISQIICAGEVADSTKQETAISEFAKVPDFLKFSLNARLRYESRNQQGLEASHAGTLRVRPGLTIFPDRAVSFFAESENTLAVIKDYQVGTPQSGNFEPFQAGNTPIGDPETHELNRAFIQYKNDSFKAKVGRQRIVLDNAAFVGNVGWRQNEQTYDGASLSYKNESIDVFYAYANQVNRIFGSDASGPVQALEGDIHLLNASWSHMGAKVGAYTYLMDFSDQGTGFPVNASNNTYGLYANLKNTTGAYRLEFAFQTEAGSKADYDALYASASYSKKVGNVTFVVGAERLEDGFVTPLATVHAFNGFADVFIGNRLGLGNTWDGLTDLYVGANTKVKGVLLKASLHNFRDDSLSETYGWEADLVAVKKLNANTKLIGKFAYFMGEDASPFNNDVGQASIQLDYSF